MLGLEDDIKLVVQVADGDAIVPVMHQQPVTSQRLRQARCEPGLIRQRPQQCQPGMQITALGDMAETVLSQLGDIAASSGRLTEHQKNRLPDLRENQQLDPPP